VNFFDHQDAAKRGTRRLVVLFTLSLLGVIAMLYLPLAVVMASEADKSPYAPSAAPWWNPGVFAAVALGSTVIILLGAGAKRLQLSGGGKAVAESLGGRWLQPAGASPAERRLLDVVEEMSIASGMPVPPVYVIEDASINAFAAGHTPKDAVLGFTRGAIDQLTRDELQGVVAHEFSHVAHGDMRLNLRLACAVAGVMVIALIGRGVLHAAARMPASRSRKGDGRAGVAVIGLVLLVVGGLGALFGRLLQAAVSRQREFLADASAAQYTRNPAGLASALRRIAGLHDNRMESDAASGLNHFFFTSAARAWLASHPPIEERIRRLEGAAVAPVPRSSRDGANLPTGAAGLASADPTPSAQGAVIPGRAVESARQILRHDLPRKLLAACQEPFDAQAVVLLLAWSTHEDAREAQRQAVRSGLGPAMTSTLTRLQPAMKELGESLQLVVLDLCMPALQQLSLPQYQAFRSTLAEVIRADGRVTLLEWTLRSVLGRRVEGRFGALRDRPGSASVASRARDAWLLLSALAHAGAPARATTALARGLSNLELPDQPPAPLASCSLDAVDAALEGLARLSETGRHRLVEAAAEVVSEDGQLHPREALLLRAVADRLDVLMPSMVELLERDAPGAALDRRR
jgi:Zn-dependent protease with chaperone function